MSTNAGSVYAGDEINAIVLDPGTYTTRIGYSGDDFPKTMVPSVYAKDDDGQIHFDSSVDYAKSNRELLPILKDSLIEDWDGAVAQYRHYFDNVLKVDYDEQPILITEPVWGSKEYRQKLIETLYEEFKFPALYLAKAPSCVSFQQGRLTCLVVDVGHCSVSVTPVVDGICLLRNLMKTHYAGQFLNDQIRDTLQTHYSKLDLSPIYKVKCKTAVEYPLTADFVARDLPDSITASYDSFQQRKIFTEAKELLLETPDKRLNSSNPQQQPTLKEELQTEENERTMEVPLGQVFCTCLERYAWADLLFDPASYPFTDAPLAEKYPPCSGELSLTPYDDYRPIKRARKGEAGQATPTPAPDSSEGVKIRGLSQLVNHAISTIDIDLRTAIASTIIVTGGSSMIPQLNDRLNAELLAANPALKIKIHASGTSLERTTQVWMGGSVLASLGTFQQMWVSKAEYEEAGVDRILTQRFR
ncbi:Actin/actin-like protein [Metschnikowia bicuspidata]|uniref:Actin-related protein 4 n=1 Tax=Metschnikowia bicuspidata TaxID=27322 RepID=A0A4P9Z705_9ASCO|nr:Actin/actin-like protein [Metschnikowia bicuspidata]RKP28939.1 Actin/actin-like protein [Metschnikowia bicuspidata]